MPLKIEVHTLIGPYITTAPEDCKDPIKWAEEKLAQGNEGFILDDGSLWKPWNRDHIVALVLVPDFPAEQEDKPDEAAEPEKAHILPYNGPAFSVHVWKEKVKYLGEYRDIKVIVTWDTKCKGYFLLYQINGKPAEEFVRPHNFLTIIRLWLEQAYGGYQGQYEVVVPHGVIDDQEEAVAYLKDYVRETAPEHKPTEKTGKAFTNWNEDRGRG